MATVFAGSQLGWRLADYEELSSGQADGSPNQNHYQHVVSLAYPWATKAGTKAETEPNACALAFIASFWFAIGFDFSSLITFLYFVVGLYCFVISNCCQFPADMTFHAIHVCLTHFALFSLDILPPPALLGLRYFWTSTFAVMAAKNLFLVAPGVPVSVFAKYSEPLFYHILVESEGNSIFISSLARKY